MTDQPSVTLDDLPPILITVRIPWHFRARVHIGVAIIRLGAWLIRSDVETVRIAP